MKGCLKKRIMQGMILAVFAVAIGLLSSGRVQTRADSVYGNTPVRLGTVWNTEYPDPNSSTAVGRYRLKLAQNWNFCKWWSNGGEYFSGSYHVLKDGVGVSTMTTYGSNNSFAHGCTVGSYDYVGAYDENSTIAAAYLVWTGRVTVGDADVAGTSSYDVLR